MSTDNEKMLELARKRFAQALEEEKPLRDEAEKDLNFVAGEQWDEALKQNRIKAGRPVLTFNRMHTFVQQVANEARQMRGEIKFIPAEDGDKDTAEVYEGLARHIQYNSQARVAYETAVDYSAGGSFGYYRFLPEYCDDESFNQEIKVKAVQDPMSVYGVLVPSCFGVEPEFAFVVEDLTKEEYESQFPNDEISDWTWAEKQSQGWVTESGVRVAEYWYVERTPKKLYLLENGMITYNLPEGRKPKSTRTVEQKQIKFCKINGVGIISGSETEWPGKRIPIFAVLGKSMVVNGKPQLFSVVRFQRSPQQLINVYKTRIAETLGTAPIQPYMVPKGAIAEEDKARWARMNQDLVPYLEYQTVSDATGQPINAPTRQVFESPISSLSQAAAQEIDDMKATAGIFDASLGAQGNETSGVAIGRRQQQADAINLHYIDNLERSFDESGRELALVMPIFYDTPRTVRILGEDEAPKLVKINQQYQDGQDVKAHYVGGDQAGKYDVLVTMGRAFSTKRMESFDQMGQVIQSAPQLLPMFGDIYFKNSDMAGADQIAERFKKMLPPNLQDQPEGQPEIPPQVQQALQQQGQMVEQLTQALHEAQNTIETQQVQAHSKERMESEKLKLEWAKLELDNKRHEFEKISHANDLDSKEAIALLTQEVKALTAGMQMNMKQAAAEAGAAAEGMGEEDSMEPAQGEATEQPTM